MSDSTRPLPGFTSWPTFPFEGDIRVKKLDEPVAAEPPRHGENPNECRACGAPDEAYIWVSERWRVRSLDRPTGLPMVLILESRSHLDLGDLPNLLAAELGVMTVRLERAVRSLDGVARVHVNRWGDGSAHLHLWFLGRPYGRLQLRGTFLSLWDEILPTISESQWRENLALVAAWLAEFGGRPLAEPPRIDWKAPALFGPAVVAADSDGANSERSGGATGNAAGTPVEDRPGTLLQAIQGDLAEQNAPARSGPAGHTLTTAAPARPASAPAGSAPAQRAAADQSVRPDGADQVEATHAGDGGNGSGSTKSDGPNAGTGPTGSDSRGAEAVGGTKPGGAKAGGAKAGGAKTEVGAPAGAGTDEPTEGAKPAGAVKTTAGAKSGERGKPAGRARSGGLRDRG